MYPPHGKSEVQNQNFFRTLRSPNNFVPSLIKSWCPCLVHKLHKPVFVHEVSKHVALSRNLYFVVCWGQGCNSREVLPPPSFKSRGLATPLLTPRGPLVFGLSVQVKPKKICALSYRSIYLENIAAGHLVCLVDTPQRGMSSTLQALPFAYRCGDNVSL